MKTEVTLTEPVFAVGDVVQLNGGGPLMTITSDAQFERSRVCMWHRSDGEMCERSIPTAALKHADRGESMARLQDAIKALTTLTPITATQPLAVDVRG